MSTTNEKTRYTDEELAEFRVMVEAKLEEARENLKMLKAGLDDGHDTSEPGGQTEGEVRQSLEETRRMVERQEKFVGHLEVALKRIANKSYGICRVTGQLISKERLRVVPHATLAIARTEPIVKR